MLSASFLVKIIVAKIILSLGYSGFLAYQPKIFSEPPQLASIAITRSQNENKQLAEKQKSLPLSVDRIKPQPRRKSNTPFSIKLSAQSYVVMDAETEKILLGEAENAPRSMASITKLMTAIIFLESNPSWDEKVNIQKEDGNQGKIYIFEGESVNVKDLFYASLVGSSNNATVALARSSKMNLEEFVKKMNKKAGELGLKQTRFVEPTGLDYRNQSTAKEVAVILKYALQKDILREALLTPNYEITVLNKDNRQVKRRVANTDILLSSDFKNSPIESILGAKTGFIDEAGYNFTMLTQNKDRNKVAVVVLGADTHFDRFSEAKVLAEWVYKNYLWPGQDGFEKLSQD